MSDAKSAFRRTLESEGYFVYDRSIDISGETVCAIVRRDLVKYLAVSGPQAGQFQGENANGTRLCPLTPANAAALHTLFPYTKPQSHAGHPFTLGLGDRLGLATPGHIRAIAGYDVFPILAQQSIRELTLTARTFEDVIAAASFGVFQEGYKSGYGADGDHLKTKDEILYALTSGCTMITLDCSEHIDTAIAEAAPDVIHAAYAALPEALRAHYETRYLGRTLPVIDTIEVAELERIVLVFHKAIAHAIDCYGYIQSIRTQAVDFELSIDETRTITTPAEHFVIACELDCCGVKPDSVAPHFSGEFEKGVEYQGDLNAFARDFVIHQQIADHFGYKLSVHSGSDKFSVFSTVGRVTGGRVHVKTAGTNWLEAMYVVAEHAPELYRRCHKLALEKRAEAERYYHVSTDPSSIPNIDLQCDAYLPEYLLLPASRQTMHIAYGLLLQERWFQDAFFPFMAAHEQAYYERLVLHIGRHLRYLTAQ